MIYNIEYEVEFTTDFDKEKIYRSVVDTVLDNFDCPYDCEVSLLFVEDEQMREINNETRGIDNSTDVLSFPNVNFEEAGKFDTIDEAEDYFEPDSGELILGDIVLSVDKIREQAKEYGHSELREYSFLICHSMLHLLGFDHMEEDERKEMEALQTKIMELLNITR